MSKLKDIFPILKECMENDMEDADILFNSYEKTEGNIWDINCVDVCENEEQDIKRITFKYI